jgi:hypothetical protein
LGNEALLRCPEKNCSLKAKGCDIEKAYDEDGEAIWAIIYECSEGHRFIAEYEREIKDAEEDLPAQSA